MKIALNARVLNTDHIRGWSRYAVNLLDGLLKSSHDIFLFSDRPINQKLIPLNSRFCQVTIRPGYNYLHWEQRVLPQLCKEHKIDILHCPTNFGLPLLGRTKKVLTLHDAIEKVFYDQHKSKADFYKWDHLKVRAYHYASQWAADQIITVSQHAQRDIVNHYGVNPKKVEVIYEGADPDFNEQSIQEFSILQKSHLGVQKPYFFYVGGLEKRKNIEFLINSWKLLPKNDYQLIIGGGSREEIEKMQVISRDAINPIVFTGYIPQNLLPSFYAHARCFVYPSLYEGFGLQLVESMKMGTPVICSNVTSLPEILGDEECTFSPVEAGSLVDLFVKMMNDDFHQKKKTLVKIRSSAFSWAEAVNKTLQVYERLLSL